MSRPKKYRKIMCNPEAKYYKPRGIPLREIVTVVLEADEVEALRLADLLGLSHEKAALQMQISRTTFGRIVKSGRSKIADAILNGKAVKISN